MLTPIEDSREQLGNSRETTIEQVRNDLLQFHYTIKLIRMKQSLILLFALCALSNYSHSQHSDSIQFPQLITGGGHNFQVLGDQSFAYRDSLFSHFGKKQKKGYVWKFKHVQVPGISEELTFEVHQGLKGYSEEPRYDANKCGGRAYFYTFTSEKQKAAMLEKQTDLEFPGLIIYVKQGNRYGVKDEEVELLKAYLSSIYRG